MSSIDRAQTQKRALDIFAADKTVHQISESLIDAKLRARPEFNIKAIAPKRAAEAVPAQEPAG